MMWRPPAARRITSALRVSTESRARLRLASARDDGQHPPALLLEVDGVGTGPRRLATDVEDVGTFSLEPQRVFDRGIRRKEAAAIGEAVGRDVDDAHDQRLVEREARHRRSRLTHACEHGLHAGIGRARQLIGADQPTADRFAIPLDEFGRSELQIIAAGHHERPLPVHARKRKSLAAIFRPAVCRDVSAPDVPVLRAPPCGSPPARPWS